MATEVGTAVIGCEASAFYIKMTNQTYPAFELKATQGTASMLNQTFFNASFKRNLRTPIPQNVSSVVDVNFPVPEVINNIQKAFDETTYTFTAPSKGVYRLEAYITLRTRVESTANLVAELILKDRIYPTVFQQSHEHLNEQTIKAMRAVLLEKGDTATLAAKFIGRTAHLKGVDIRGTTLPPYGFVHILSSFTGVKLY